MAKEIVLHTNKVYIGDPCYVIKGPDYDKLCDTGDGTVVPGVGICYSTGCGDCELEDNDGNLFNFDSGQIAIVDASHCDLSVKKDASFFERLFVDSLLTIEVPSGSAKVTMDKDSDGDIWMIVIDESNGDMLFHSYLHTSD